MDEREGMSAEELYALASQTNDTRYLTTRFAPDSSVKEYYLFHLAHRIVDYTSINRELGVIIISIDERLLDEVCNPEFAVRRKYFVWKY